MCVFFSFVVFCIVSAEFFLNGYDKFCACCVVLCCVLFLFLFCFGVYAKFGSKRQKLIFVFLFCFNIFVFYAEFSSKRHSNVCMYLCDPRPSVFTHFPSVHPSPDGFQEDGGARQLSKTLRQDVWEKPTDLLKMAVPACLYVLQNNLNYVAVSNLDGPTFQLLYQLKILTTALFSVLMLKR